MRILSIILIMLLMSSCSKYRVQVVNPRGSFHDGEYHNGHFYPYPPNTNTIIPSTPLPRRVIKSSIKKNSKSGLNQVPSRLQHFKDLL
jgi:hypothetical protein